MGCLCPEREVDVADDDGTGSTCSRHLDGSVASDSSRCSDVSYGPEVAAAVAAARRRMQQHAVSAPRSPANTRQPGASSHNKGGAGAASLAALASATLKKLERLSAETARM